MKEIQKNWKKTKKINKNNKKIAEILQRKMIANLQMLKIHKL